MTKLAQRTLEAVRVSQNDEILREEGNLFGRIRARSDGNVSVSFYYRHRFDGKSKDLSCGTWPADSLAAIRATRDAARAKVAEGINPAIEKKIIRHERQEETASKLATMEALRAADLTVNDLFTAWITDGVRRKDGNAELQRQFGADVLPKIGAIAVKGVTEHHLRGVLRTLVDRSVNRSAVVLRNNLTQMFENHILYNPASELDVPKVQRRLPRKASSTFPASWEESSNFVMECLVGLVRFPHHTDQVPTAKSSNMTIFLAATCLLVAH